MTYLPAQIAEKEAHIASIVVVESAWLRTADVPVFEICGELISVDDHLAVRHGLIGEFAIPLEE